METEKMIFWRDFLLRIFLVGIAFVVIIAIAWLIFSNSAMMPWIAGLFKLNDNELGRYMLRFIGAARFLLIFFVLVPCIALHWMIKSKK
jgi:hypothetical protein